jgi:glycosyltransferase involved in cell wall biosynthesis
MRILQVCKKIPYPSRDGEVIAIINLAKALVSLDAEVDILSLNTNKHFTDITSIPPALTNQLKFYTTFLNTDLKWYNALFAMLINRPYNILRFESKLFKEQLKELITNHQYDVIQLEGLPLLLYVEDIRKYSQAKIVYRAHNVEHQIWQRLAANERNIFKRLYYKILTQQVKSFEITNAQKVDFILPITSLDAAFFAKEVATPKPMHIVPACLDDIAPVATNTVTSHQLFFIGALDWLPNQEGIRWFIQHCLPIIVKAFPDTIFHIAGRHMPASFVELASPNVILYGEVESAKQFMEEKGLMIVPLLSGGGMRIKIIEAMMLQKAIVSTAVGAEGIDYQHREHLFIADEANQFAGAIIELFNHPTLADEIASKARQLALQSYSAKKVAADLLQFYRKRS